MHHPIIKNSIALFIAMLALSSCNKDKDKGKNPEVKRHYFYQNARIVGTTASSGWGANYSLGPGDFLVFERQYTSAEEEKVMDDEYSEKFAFQIDPSLESFAVSDTALYSLNPVFGYYCYCSPNTSPMSLKGTIAGNKTGADSWQVNTDVKFIYKIISTQTLDTVELKFSEKYVMAAL